jgi:phage tail sheath protein FI
VPEYLAPGVYIEEVSTGPHPIQGVSTARKVAVVVVGFAITVATARLIQRRWLRGIDPRARRWPGRPY